MVSRYSASPRESAEFPTTVKEVVAMFVQEAWANVRAVMLRDVQHLKLRQLE